MRYGKYKRYSSNSIGAIASVSFLQKYRFFSSLYMRSRKNNRKRAATHNFKIMKKIIKREK